MKKDKYAGAAQQIINLAGGKQNIIDINCCITRLRLDAKNINLVDLTALKKLGYVIGAVISGNQVQIILGPGKADKMKETIITCMQTQDAQNIATPILTKIIEVRPKNRVKVLLRSLSKIFVPLIPGFIGCGFILAINNTLNSFYPGWDGGEVSKLLAIFGSAIYLGLNIFIGMNTAKVIGGTPVLGGIMAVILTQPGLDSINIMGMHLSSTRGGIIAVMFVAAFAAWLEVKMRKIVPQALNLIVTPFCVIFISGILAIFALQPAGDFISASIVKGVDFFITHGGPVTGFFLAGLFLPLVMLGLHHALAPVHAQLIAEHGFTVLFPILAMAGAGQVGAAIAVLIKTKKTKLKKTIYSALPIGLLGMGEPLIYGVTLPLGKPFFAACIGGACGGAVMAVFKVGATAIGGISGLPLLFLTTKPFLYLIGLLTAYIAGFAASWLMGFDDSQYEVPTN